MNDESPYKTQTLFKSREIQRNVTHTSVLQKMCPEKAVRQSASQWYMRTALEKTFKVYSEFCFVCRQLGLTFFVSVSNVGFQLFSRIVLSEVKVKQWSEGKHLWLSKKFLCLFTAALRSCAFLNTLTMGTPFPISHAFRQLFNNGNGVATRSPSKWPLRRRVYVVLTGKGPMDLLWFRGRAVLDLLLFGSHSCLSFGRLLCCLGCQRS